MMDELALLHAWRAGDTAAGDEVVRRYYSRVLRYFELRANSSAEDLTQRTFLACVHGKLSLREPVSFRAYLFAIARHVYQDRQRKLARNEVALRRLGADAADVRTSVSVVIARKHEQRLLLRALATLPDDLASALQMYYWEDMRTAEIGAALDIPKSTVTSRLARARELLHAAIVELGKRSDTRDALLSNVDGWTRSLAEPASIRSPGAGIAPPESSGNRNPPESGIPTRNPDRGSTRNAT